MRYTIEERELTNASAPRPSFDREPRRITLEAQDPDEAISRFVVQNASELVSVTRPAQGRESIATVKKDECMYLVRVYAA
ncbi:MAG: hypothetical protein NVSMB68_07440 [Thermoanaerobaculia bacterium]